MKVPPERATRSTSSRPWRLKNVKRPSMVAFGGGMFLFEPLRLAVFESLLPNGSSQLGPPLCFKRILIKFQIKHVCISVSDYLIYIETNTHIWSRFNHIVLKMFFSYKNSGSLSSKGNNICTWDCTRTCLFQLRFDLINHFKTSNGIFVRSTIFFTDNCGAIVQQNWCIAALSLKV